MQTQSMTQIKRSEYDSLSDILYVHFANDRGDSYGAEAENGVEIFKDCETNEITGFEVYHIQLNPDERQNQMREMGLNYDLHQLCKNVI